MERIRGDRRRRQAGGRAIAGKPFPLPARVKNGLTDATLDSVLATDRPLRVRIMSAVITLMFGIASGARAAPV